MKKSDLKTGMILEQMTGDLCMVLLGTENGDIVSGKTWHPIEGLSDNQLFMDKYSVYAVNAIYQPKTPMNYLGGDGKITTCGCDLIWKREEPKELTIEEIQEKLGYKIKVVEKHK